jgi:hypothetical protein
MRWLLIGMAAVALACSSADGALPGDDAGTPNADAAPDQKSGPPPLGPAQPSGGVLLESDGTIVPFGGVKLDTAHAPSWPSQDFARALVVLSDGSGGWVLDAHGAVHEFGTAPAIVSGWASAQDDARALVVLADEASGWILDKAGALHAFGAAPTFASGYADATVEARGLDVHRDAKNAVDGGWVLDAHGGMHSFGAATDIGAPPHYDDYSIWTKLHVVQGGAYVIGRFGIIQPLGTPLGIPLTGLPDTKDADVVRDIVPISPAGAFDPSRALTCPDVGWYCGSDGIRGAPSVLYTCTKAGDAPAATGCASGCSFEPSGTPDFCTGTLACSALQWWNSALTYGPYQDYGWWDTDLAVSHDTPVVLRHDSKLYKTGVYAWGYMPEFVDLVTNEKFRFLHLRPQHQLATNVGQVYAKGTIVGYSGGDTADTGLGTYSTGAHLCVQTLDAYRTVFPTGVDACQ